MESNCTDNITIATAAKHVDRIISSQNGDSAEQLPPHQLKYCYIRATLHHLDGATSQILTTVPRYSSWSEFLEDGQMQITEYVNNLTQHWVKISHFTTEVGTLNIDGSYSPAFLPIKQSVPLNKVFKSGEYGEWVTPDQHPHNPRYNQRGSSIDVTNLVEILTKRNEAVYNKIDSNNVQCGIPVESKNYYFLDSDLPAGSFEKNGTTYLVIFNLINDHKQM